MANIEIKAGSRGATGRELVHVALITTLGAVYTFPDMTSQMLCLAGTASEGGRMDEIKTAKVALAEGPSPRQLARDSQLVHVAFATTMGAYYSFPDLLQEHFNELLQQLDVKSEQIIARNVSGVTLVIPMRILDKLYLLQVDESWKIHESSPQARMSELWSRQ